MTQVLVTGANGFVGRALCKALLGGGHAVTGLVRKATPLPPGVVEWIDASTDFAGVDAGWPASLHADCVVHLAARVHVMNDTATDPDAAFRATNVDGALRVAQAAWRHGVRRFVFVSSIKAVAESDAGRPVREDDPPTPQDAYGRSKLAAEQALIRYSQETGLDLVIVRPPLVYGPQVRANFLSLMGAIGKGMPLPLGLIDARRSIVYLDNLADALVRCAIDPRAARQSFHVADNDATQPAPSVAELARMLGRHLGKPARLVPVPVSWLRVAGRLTGRSAQVDRLVGALQLDTARIRSVLGWQAPHSTDEGLAATAQWYRATESTEPPRLSKPRH